MRCRRKGNPKRDRVLDSIQNEGFQNLVLGSSVTLDNIQKKAPSNWYLKAKEAKG